MAELTGLEDWQQARLIPVGGIRGQEEQEARATSAFLAVLSAVPAFAYALLGELGAPRGPAQTFTEVRLKAADGKVGRPDGAIVVKRGAPDGDGAFVDFDAEADFNHLLEVVEPPKRRREPERVILSPVLGAS